MHQPLKTESLTPLAADTLPIGVVTLDGAARVLSYNRVTRLFCPKIRRNAKFSLFTDSPLPSEGTFSLLRFPSEHALSCCETDGEETTLYLLRICAEDVKESFLSHLGTLGPDLVSLIRRTAHTKEDAEGERYLKETERQCSDHLPAHRDLMQSLSSVRNLYPNRAFAVSAGELVHFFAKSVAPTLEKRGATLEIDAEGGLVTLVNFHDFVSTLAHVTNFLLCFVYAKELVLSLRKEDGWCVFELSGEDRFDFTALWRVFTSPNVSKRTQQRQSALFYPLFLAAECLSAYRHRLLTRKEDGRIRVKISTPQTYEFPTLVVRESEEDEALSDLRYALSETIFSSEVLARLSALYTELEGEKRTAAIHTPDLF